MAYAGLNLRWTGNGLRLIGNRAINIVEQISVVCHYEKLQLLLCILYYKKQIYTL